MTNPHPPGMGELTHFVESQPEMTAASLLDLRARLTRIVYAAAEVFQENLLDEALSGGLVSAERLLGLVNAESARIHDRLPR